MNINATNLADILERNGIISSKDRTDKNINSTSRASNSAGVRYTRRSHNNTGLANGNYTYDSCRNMDEKETNYETASTYNQIRQGIIAYTNNVSADVYEKFEEIGIIPDQEEPDTFLTVGERIEIELATHCEDYVPTGSIDIDDIRALYGESGLAYEIAAALKDYGLNITYDAIEQIENGLKMVEEIGNITPKISAYLLKNDLPISIENVYKAQYSVADSEDNYNKTLINDDDWKVISNQITKKLESVGIKMDDAILQDAKWMLENNIPVTSSSILKMREIHMLNGVNSGSGLGSITQEQWIHGMAAGMVFESSVMQMEAKTAANETKETSVVNMATEAVDVFKNGNEEQIEEIISQEKEVTLLNLKQIQEEAIYKNTKRQPKSEQEYIHKEEVAKHYLNEIKLTMSVSGFATLLNNGFELQIASLQDIVKELRQQNDIYADAMFSSVKNLMELNDQEIVVKDRELFWSSIGYMKDFLSTPAYVLGNVAKKETAFEVEEICAEGGRYESLLKSANMAYDTLGTKPRKDLGDSIQKAFDGIDEILKDMQIEVNAVNNRAVRILAYNEMEITKENLLVIKELDMQVSRLIENMTPRTTAYLIANGINPLKTDIRKLNDELEEINQKIEADTGEKFSKFLWKLDKTNKITQENRKNYIGLYRALNTIQKLDRKAIGEVIKEGNTVTINSLLTAARSEGKHFNTAVDDNLGLTEETIIPDNNIDIQLEGWTGEENLEISLDIQESYYKSLINQGMDKISPQMTNVNERMDMPLETVVQDFMTYAPPEEEIPENENLNDYYEELIKEDAKARFVTEDVINNLIGNKIAPSISNLLAASDLMMANGKSYFKLIGFKKEESIREKTKLQPQIPENAKGSDTIEEDILDSMESKKEFEAKYQKLLSDISNNVKTNLKDDYSIAQLREMNRNLSYLNQAQKKDSYYIPVTIDNENTVLHLTIRNGMMEKGKVEIEFTTEKYGNVKCELYIKEKNVTAFVKVDNEEMEERLLANQDIFGEQVLVAGMTLTGVDIGMQTGKHHNMEDEVNLQSIESDSDNETKNTDVVSTDKLYQFAKNFIQYVKVACKD